MEERYGGLPKLPSYTHYPPRVLPKAVSSVEGGHSKSVVSLRWMKLTHHIFSPRLVQRIKTQLQRRNSWPLEATARSVFEKLAIYKRSWQRWVQRAGGKKAVEEDGQDTR